MYSQNLFDECVLFLDENTRMLRGEGDGGMKRVECNHVNNIHIGLDKLALNRMYRVITLVVAYVNKKQRVPMFYEIYGFKLHLLNRHNFSTQVVVNTAQGRQENNQ